MPPHRNYNQTNLIDHMRGRLQVLIDSDVTFPLIDEPVAHAELESAAPSCLVERIEVLVVQHPRRHVHRVALVPIVAFAANLRIAVAFERVRDRLPVRAWLWLLVCGKVDEDRADR